MSSDTSAFRSPFKPGVRYFVDPNYMTLDPPAMRAVERARARLNPSQRQVMLRNVIAQHPGGVTRTQLVVHLHWSEKTVHRVLMDLLAQQRIARTLRSNGRPYGRCHYIYTKAQTERPSC